MKWFLFADDMVGYEENPKGKKIIPRIKEFNKVTTYKIYTQSSISFLYPNNMWNQN